MKNLREIKMVLTRKPTTEGAGVHLNRVFGFVESPQLDPFLKLDDFRSDNPEHYMRGFPWHPHRGIETITYVTKGDVEHGDSLGNEGIISTGDVQWMTAGSEALRFLLVTGKPLNEPVAWRGPIVMNTEAELELAFREYREGTFIKNK